MMLNFQPLDFYLGLFSSVLLLLRSDYMKLPIFTHCSSTLLNISTTSVLEVFTIMCWHATWSLTDTAAGLVTSDPEPRVRGALALALATVTGLLAHTLQVPLLYFSKYE